MACFCFVFLWLSVFCLICLCVSCVIYNVGVPGLFVCACLSDRVCLTFTVFVWFMCALLGGGVCFVVVLLCMCLCAVCFRIVFACFDCGLD